MLNSIIHTLSPFTSLIIVALLIKLIYNNKGRGGISIKWVYQSLQIDEHMEDNLIELKARPAGLLHLVAIGMQGIGIGEKSAFRMNAREMSLTNTSFFRYTVLRIPIANIKAVEGGYERSKSLLFWGIGLVLGGLVGGGEEGIVLVLVGIGCLFVYSMVRQHYIRLLAGGDEPYIHFQVRNSTSEQVKDADIIRMVNLISEYIKK